jgi:hypothetical protein
MRTCGATKKIDSAAPGEKMFDDGKSVNPPVTS